MFLAGQGPLLIWLGIDLVSELLRGCLRAAHCDRRRGPVFFVIRRFAKSEPVLIVEGLVESPVVVVEIAIGLSAEIS